MHADCDGPGETPLLSRSLILLLAVALVMRIGWVMTLGSVDARLPDQREYLEIADNLLSGRGLTLYDPRFSQDVHAFRMPGYPLFVAACGGSIPAVRIVQCLLDVTTVLAVYLLARRWFASIPALAGAGLVAFNPFLIFFCGQVLSETLFTCLLTWGMTLLLWRPNLLWGGSLLALSVLVRPSGLALPVILGIAAAFFRRGRTWLRLPVGTTMLVLTLMALTPWAIRNRVVLGQWLWLTTNGGITKYDGFHPDATGGSDQTFLKRPDMALLSQMNELSRDAYLSSAADRNIRQAWKNQPKWLLMLTLKKIGRLWTPMPLSEEFSGRRSLVAVAVAWWAVFYGLVAVGMVCRWSGGRGAKVFLLLPAIYLTLVHAASVGSLRYRVPAEAPLAVVAAGAVAAMQAQRVRQTN